MANFMDYFQEAYHRLDRARMLDDEANRTGLAFVTGLIADLEPVLQGQTASYRHRMSGTERHLLIGQIMRYMDIRTRGMFVLRVKGFTWEQVGAFTGMKANHAAVAYNEGVEKARQRILRSTPGRSKPAVGRVR